MRLKISLIVLTLIATACTSVGTPLSPPESASAASTDTPAPEPATEVPTNTLAPFEDDTPLPPTIAAPVVSSPGITSLHMLNELDGWAISENAILRTTDGASTWYNVSPQGVNGIRLWHRAYLLKRLAGLGHGG